MKKFVFILLICFTASYGFSESIFQDSFEYANTEGETPVGWNCPENSWICGKFEQEHNCKPHTGNWYIYTQNEDSWIFLRTDALFSLHYDLSFWTISDGAFQLEICYGDNPNPESMHGQIASEIEISSNNYQKISTEYELYENFELYLGFHAISNGGAALCIDDVAIDQMHQYDFIVKTITTDTLELAYGESASFRFSVFNTGYDQETLVLSSPSEMFTETHYFIDGEPITRFDIEPNENIIIDVNSTLIDQEIPYAYAWLDVMVGSTHNCNTGMASFFVKPINTTQINETQSFAKIFPNPASDMLFIDADDFQGTIIYDESGRQILSSLQNSIDIQGLKSGIYFIAIKTARQTLRQSFVKQ